MEHHQSTRAPTTTADVFYFTTTPNDYPHAAMPAPTARPTAARRPVTPDQGPSPIVVLKLCISNPYIHGLVRISS